MNVYEVGPFRLNADRLTLSHNGRAVSLGPRVLETLLALVERAGNVVPKEALLDRVWPEGFVEEANLSQNIYVLRKTFRSYGCANSIETVPREGYRLTVSIRHEREMRPWFDRLTMTKRVAAAALSVMFGITSLLLLASYDSAHRPQATSRLTESGARAYEIGRYYWNLRTWDSVEKSIGYFSRVIDTDPNDARGYAALADANITMADYCYGTHRPVVYLARAEAYATKALALDPNSAQAHAALGFLALHRNQTADAMTELRRSIALDSSYAPAHEWIGIALVRNAQLGQGLRELKTASRLDPLSVSTAAWLGSVAFANGRFADAILYSRQALELAPQRTDALTTIGEAYEARGDMDHAIDAFKRYAAIDPYYRAQAAALLARAYAVDGRMPEARAELSYARAHSGEVDRAYLAVAVAAVQNAKVTPALLERVQGHMSSLAIENAARFNVLRSRRSAS